MKLIDILLEETPAEKAKKMGLEKKPGFGNYGPIGKDTVTHMSRQGKLVPKKEKAKVRPKKKVVSAKKKRVAPKKAPSKAVKKVKQTKIQTPKTTSFSDEQVAKFVATSFDEKGMFKGIKEVSLATTQAMGSKNIPKKISTFEDSFDLLSAMAMEGFAAGAYNPADNVIGLAKGTLQELDSLEKIPVSKWHNDWINGYATVVHESVHASSPRLNGELGPDEARAVINSSGALSFEEGMTEYLARQLTTKALAKNGLTNPIRFEAYPDLVQMMDWMVEYGEFDVSETFKKPFNEMIMDGAVAHQTALANILLKLKMPEESIKDVMVKSAQLVQHQLLILSVPSFQTAFLHYLNNPGTFTPALQQEFLDGFMSLRVPQL